MHEVARKRCWWILNGHSKQHFRYRQFVRLVRLFCLFVYIDAPIESDWRSWFCFGNLHNHLIRKLIASLRLYLRIQIGVINAVRLLSVSLRQCVSLLLLLLLARSDVTASCSCCSCCCICMCFFVIVWVFAPIFFSFESNEWMNE